MVADDDDSDDGLINNLNELVGGAALPQQQVAAKIQVKAKALSAHLRTEIAFSHVKHHQVIETSRERGLLLGSADLNIRIEQMQIACRELRQNKFFLLAVELKEKEKNLLMQKFAYGDANINQKGGQNPSLSNLQSNQGVNQNGDHNLFATLD